MFRRGEFGAVYHKRNDPFRISPFPITYFRDREMSDRPPHRRRIPPYNERPGVSGRRTDLEGAFRTLRETLIDQSDSFASAQAFAYLHEAVKVRWDYLEGKRGYLRGTQDQLEAQIDRDRLKEMTNEVKRLDTEIRGGGNAIGIILKENKDYATSGNEHRKPRSPSPFFPILGECMASYGYYVSPPTFRVNLIGKRHSQSSKNSTLLPGIGVPLSSPRGRGQPRPHIHFPIGQTPACPFAKDSYMRI